MVNFYPGPSKLDVHLPVYLQEAYASGLLSMNHRSNAFASFLKKTIDDLKKSLNIPEQYNVLFFSSATECWEVIAQSLIKHRSTHIYTGDFGLKWYEYTRKIKPGAQAKQLAINDLLEPEKLSIPLENEWICLTHNETSNGTQVQPELISAVRKAYPDQYIAIDATSSLGGVELPYADADVWFASLQKCMGLPAGLGIFLYNSHVVDKAEEVNDLLHYNSFLFVHENILRFQTPYTPNTLGIYLLGKIVSNRASLSSVSAHTKERAQKLYSYFEGFSDFQTIAQNPYTLSDTVLAFQGDKDFISVMTKIAQDQGIILGKGYGTWKENSFRLANFPAITEDDIEDLIRFFNQY